MPRWMLTIGLCVFLCGPALAQEEGEEPAAADEEAPGAPVPDEAAEATAEEAPAAPDGPDTAALTWEQAWDGGFALYRAGHYADAIEYLERALELEPNDPTVRAYLADCYSRTGDEARAAELSAATQAPDTVEASSSDEPAEHGNAAAYAPSHRRHHGQGHGQAALRTVRKGRHFGFGLAIAGNALSAGMYFEGLPVQYLSIQGGLGLGDVHTFFWWVQASVLPLDLPLTPSVGMGVLGTMGLDFHYQRSTLRGDSIDYYLNRVNPYVHVGLVLVTFSGFTASFDINGVFTGDPGFPLAPWIGVRLGLLI